MDIDRTDELGTLSYREERSSKTAFCKTKIWDENKEASGCKDTKHIEMDRDHVQCQYLLLNWRFWAFGLCYRSVSHTLRFAQWSGASWNWEHTWSTIRVYARQSNWNSNTITLDPDRPQHNRPKACVIAQQHSSATVISPRSVRVLKIFTNIFFLHFF